MWREIADNLKRYLPKAIFFLYLGTFFFSKTNLVIVDLGRHLMNGKLFLEQGTVLRTNLYSYTYSDFPVITHHWGAGVIYYLVHALTGFNGLIILGVLLAILTAFFLFKNSQKRGSFVAFALVALLLFPLFASRNVPPYVFVAVVLGKHPHLFRVWNIDRVYLYSARNYYRKIYQSTAQNASLAFSGYRSKRD
ncbi:MAG: hypothetical protein UV44_C0014G0016 [candidate division WWE3 bacterium GW2011_GWD1_42_70]|nr:MAG: hypothetical protein UV44_C0014G0016 [candidate division WWE3 bacterium GW2011_GWD1_42_70]